MSLKDLTSDELNQRIADASQAYRNALRGNFFHTDSSLEALKALEPLTFERDRRYQEARQARAENDEQLRLQKENQEIEQRRPKNPTVADIPKCSIDSDQTIVREIPGWAVVSTLCTSGKVWTVYEFDLHLWLWIPKSHRPRRKGALYYFEGCDSPTEEDMQAANAHIEQRLREWREGI